MAFTTLFGGSPVQASNVAYLSYALTTSIVLTWPADSEINPIARLMDFTAPVGCSVTLPSANEVSPGQDTVIRNLGANPIAVLDAFGGSVATITPGQIIYVYLTDNTTVAGMWSTVVFGVGASLVDSAALQGAGLIAVGSRLAQAHPTTTVFANTTITAADRANVKVWAGGVGSFFLPTSLSVGNTFFFEVANQGTGGLTLTPQDSELIDSGNTITLQPGDSAFIHAAPPTNWYSVGRGRSAQFNFTQLVKTVTGGTDTLSSTEAANVVQKYVGALGIDEVVVLPAVVQVYYVSNATTGAHTLTFQSPTPGSIVTVPSNQNAILFCDGTNVINTSTTVAGLTSVVLAQGSESSPPLSFTGNVNTGVYQASTDSVSITAGGSEVARFSADTIGLNVPLTLPAVGTGENSSHAATTAFVKAQGYFSTPTQINAAIGYVPANKAGDVFTGAVAISPTTSGDTLVLQSISGSTALTVRGIAGTDVGGVRFVKADFSGELSRLSSAGDGTLTFSHAGASSMALSASSVIAYRPVNITVDGSDSLSLLGTSTNAVNFKVTNIGLRAWSYGIAGNAGPAPAGSFFFLDVTGNRVPLYIDTAGKLTVLGPVDTSGDLNVGRSSTGDRSIFITNSTRQTRFTLGASNGGMFFVDDTASIVRWVSDAVGNFTIPGASTAASFAVSSGLALKNVQGRLDGQDAFDRVMSWMPTLYTLKAERDSRLRAGLIVEEAPKEITDGEGHIDLYAALTEVGAALQYLARKVGAA